MPRKQDTYKEPKIMKFPGMQVKVYSPILTPEERQRRMEQIKKAAASLVMSREVASS